MTREETPTRRALLATGAVAAAALAGCSGGGSDTTTTEPTATDTTAPTDTATATATDTGAETATPTDSGATTPGAVETLVSIPDDRVPENLAFGPDGDLYFGITAGEVRRLSNERLDETGLTIDDTEQVATLPGAIGVEVAPDGTVYVAVSADGDAAGVYEVPPDAEATQLVTITGFPNDILYDGDRDRLLVTESTGGVVYAVGRDGSRSTWLDVDTLDTESFGANGITMDAEGTVTVAVTRAANETGRLVAAPMTDDGSAGEASTVLEDGAIFGADGITARGEDIYVAANSQNRVVRVGPDGGTETVADAEDGLVFPSDVLFGPGGLSNRLFVCNFANQSPADGAILRQTYSMA